MQFCLQEEDDRQNEDDDFDLPNFCAIISFSLFSSWFKSFSSCLSFSLETNYCPVITTELYSFVYLYLSCVKRETTDVFLSIEPDASLNLSLLSAVKSEFHSTFVSNFPAHF